MVPDGVEAQAAPRRERREALFVRIPASLADRLDRAAFELRASKQELVTGLLERHVDPASPASLAGLRALLTAPAGRREHTPADGWATAAPGGPPGYDEPSGDVLTLADAARLLRADEREIARLAETGTLPGRRIGGRWRFARAALLAWLGRGEG